MGNIQRYTPVRLYPKAPLYSIIIIVDTVLRQNRNIQTRKVMKSTLSPYCHFGMHDQGLPTTSARHTSTVRNVKIALFENIVLLLHPHVDVPYSLVLLPIQVQGSFLEWEFTAVTHSSADWWDLLLPLA